MSASSSPDYRQHLLVETPEHVLLDYELAGVGSRTLAALIDWTLVALLLFTTVLAGAWLGALGAWGRAFLVLILYAVMASYFTFFEGMRDGQTPGKRFVGIRVIRDTGHAATLADAAARNLMNVPDMMVVGVFLIMLHPRAKRLGDLLAGTVVVRDQPAAGRLLTPPAPAAGGDASTGIPELTDAEFRMLREFQQRAGDLPAEARSRIARMLGERLATRIGPGTGGDDTLLAALYQDELARRQGRFAARGGGGSPAERLVARKGPRWDAFGDLAHRVTRNGLDTLAAPELPDFAARYREVAADLARARTYRADQVALLRLERLVAAGHNALYRNERRTWHTVWTFLAHDCPAEVVRSWRTVLLAFLVFAVPAGAGYATLRERPDLYATLIPDGMIERAEAGAKRAAGGEGYVTVTADERPFLAARLMVNNIRVCLLTFTGGFFLGVGALVVVAFNGLQLGVITGYFANLGLAGYLWTFVAGHGVLELFAIWLAGAAGLRLGLAIINPGRHTRADALAVAGRRAMCQVTVVVLLLVVAGTIEGLISAGGYRLETRLAVTGISAAFLLGYLGNGARRRQDVSP